jgi:hypothetical protein
MEKQQKILQMAKDICRVKHICNDVCNPISACDALKYAERAVEAGYSKQEWISVDERLPEREGKYLVYTYKGGIKFGEYRSYLVGEGKLCEPQFDYYVTHWMPLPEVPKGGAE